MSPVLAISRPILIVAAAAALRMNGLANGVAAIAAGPSSARRRGTTSPEFLAVMEPPSTCHPVRVANVIVTLGWPAYRDGARQATRPSARLDDAAPVRPSARRHSPRHIAGIRRCAGG